MRKGENSLCLIDLLAGAHKHTLTQAHTIIIELFQVAKLLLEYLCLIYELIENQLK